VAGLGLCIVGCGRFAGFHAQAARRLGEPVAVSFASRDARRAEAYRRRFGGVAAFGSYEAAAADPRVDGLLFCTPHALHRENVHLAAEHRKAVLLEKPIACTLEDADAMVAEARAAGVPFMVGENYHFAPAFVAVRRLLRTGAIGPVRQIVAAPRVFRRPGGWRRERGQSGGGLLIDSGVHFVHLFRDWAGPVAAVTAAAPPNLFPELEGEDTAFVLVRFRSGAVGTLAMSVATPGLPRLEPMWITGSSGSLGADPRGRFLWLRAGGRRRLRLFLRDRRGLAAQLAEFVAAVRERREPAVPAAEAREDLAVVLAAYRSLETGTAVAL
jgi:UDP-N-acetyl-2-amino-2-deoxyglucuronate dehydrogenase